MEKTRKSVRFDQNPGVPPGKREFKWRNAILNLISVQKTPGPPEGGGRMVFSMVLDEKSLILDKTRHNGGFFIENHEKSTGF